MRTARGLSRIQTSAVSGPSGAVSEDDIAGCVEQRERQALAVLDEADVGATARGGGGLGVDVADAVRAVYAARALVVGSGVVVRFEAVAVRGRGGRGRR